MSSMLWADIKIEINKSKTEFLRVAKCVDKKRLPKEETVQLHITTLIEIYKHLCEIFKTHYADLTVEHKNYVVNLFSELRDKLVRVFGRCNIKIVVPSTLTETLDNSNKIESDEETNSDTDEEEKDIKMAGLSLTEFMNFASKALPEFDGKPENLQRFIDGLNMVRVNVGAHLALAIELIKTKLGNDTRQLITNEVTIEAIIDRLREEVKTETSDSLAMKLATIKPHKVSTAEYVQELEGITRKLANAYIAESVSPQQAKKYATRAAVKSIIANTADQQTKVIMTSGLRFDNIAEVTEQLLAASQIATGNANVNFYENGGTTNYNSDRARGKGGGRGYNNRGGRGNRGGQNYGQGQNYYGNQGYGGQNYQSRNYGNNGYRGNYQNNGNRWKNQNNRNGVQNNYRGGFQNNNNNNRPQNNGGYQNFNNRGRGRGYFGNQNGANVHFYGENEPENELAPQEPNQELGHVQMVQ